MDSELGLNTRAVLDHQMISIRSWSASYDHDRP